MPILAVQKQNEYRDKGQVEKSVQKSNLEAGAETVPVKLREFNKIRDKEVMKMDAIQKLVDADIDKRLIELMKAGGELDAKIAIEVMGWYDADVFGLHAENADGYKNKNDKFISLVPKYSTDISAAWEVVNKLGYIELSTDEGVASVFCRFLKGSGYAPSVQGYMGVPEAICKAALLAKL